ncbi:MAG TPA: non-canonical purine NTP pyrophosphatase [Longimicrobiales bacterium]|nr:non-canonical purine NTP pyrophosphatase [Longimicrobiales bacterium]
MTRPGPLLIASRSPDKVREIRAILCHLPRLALLSLEEADVGPEAAEESIETFETFRENALAKARYFVERTGLAVLADDSGIEIDELDGAPGVRSRRFCGRDDLTGQDLDRANNDLLLERLRGLPANRRGARYVCAAVLLAPGTAARTAVGTCRGRILEEPRGSGGFGYDPLFWVEAATATFGALPPDQKHRFSHRARAFRALANVF